MVTTLVQWVTDSLLVARKVKEKGSLRQVQYFQEFSNSHHFADYSVVKKCRHAEDQRVQLHSLGDQ
jgi:uncharacterized protein YktA (UPF0223 family)